MPPSVISLLSRSLPLSVVLGTQFSLSVSIWVSLLKFKHLAPKQPFVSNLADRGTKIAENTSRNKEEREEVREEKKNIFYVWRHFLLPG